MDKIGNINHIIEIIRSHTKSGVSEAKNNKNTSAKIQPPTRPKKISAEELKRNISQKLKAAAKNPDFTSKSKDIFLESIILWEFGNQLVNNPLFTEIRTRVRQTIDSNAKATEKLEKLIDQLTSK